MTQAYFITGTDTGVGKTFISCALLHAFAAQGQRVVGMKPVAAGCHQQHGKLVSEDVEQLQVASNVALPTDWINPYAFEPPIAPHIAAAQAGVEISIAEILQRFAQLQQHADTVIVEGVGGFCVPLNDHENTADLAAQLDLPVIMVVGLRLGCLNHALLTAQAIKNKGLRLAGWVANHINHNFNQEMDESAQNISGLQRRLDAPLLCAMPYHPSLAPAACAGMFNLQKLSGRVV